MDPLYEALLFLKKMQLESKVGKFPTYETFANGIPESFLNLMGQKIEERFPETGPLEVTAFIEYLHPVYVAWQAGMRTFKLTPDLVRLLRDTEIPDSPIEFLRLPFEGIVIEVEKDTFAKPADHVRKIFLAHTDDRLRLSYVIDANTTQFINVVTKGTKTIHEGIQATRKRSDEFIKGLVEVDGIETDDVDSYGDMVGTEIFRVILNAVLYITAPGDVVLMRTEATEIHNKLQGLKGGSRRDKLEAKYKEAKSKYIYICGRSVRLGEGYEVVEGLRKTAEGRKLLTRHRVRGFWRMQVYGKERAERKLVWIQPYYRGPSMAELVEKQYHVQ